MGDHAINRGPAVAKGNLINDDDAKKLHRRSFYGDIAMFYMIKSDVMFRNYGSFGYITDNRNFGYKKADMNDDDIGDKIVSQSGAVFLSALCQKPQTLDEIVRKIILQFNDVNFETIMIDAKEFYKILEHDGFIVSGETKDDCHKKDSKFSYKMSEPAIAKSYFQNNVAIKKHTQDFFESFFNGEPQLTNLHLEITSMCNERCFHCYLPHDKKVNHIETRLLFNILKQCNEMKLLHLTLTGGEPMLHPDFIKILKKCKFYNLSVNVLSNLTLLNDEIIEEMVTNRLLSVQVSLYSMDAKIHDTITQTRGSFDLTKNAIMKLVEKDIPLQISCPIMKQNKNSYKQVLSWAKRHNIHVGCDYVIIGKCDNTTENIRKSRVSINDIEEVIEYKIYNDPLYLELLESESENKKNSNPDDIVCSVCHSSICIAENGNVYPCAGWQGYVVGNVKETSLKDIWNNSRNIQYLRSLRKRDFPKCVQCPEKDYCTMCMVRNANEHPSGDLLVVNDFFCNIAKINKKIVKKARLRSLRPTHLTKPD